MAMEKRVLFRSAWLPWVLIAPQLATMLCVITTDAVVTAGQLQAALNVGVEMSFNRIDVDGCMSTNDTVLLLASGASGV